MDRETIKFCCGCCSPRTGTLLIGVLYVLLSFLGFCMGEFMLPAVPETTRDANFYIANAGLFFVLALLMVLGALRRNHKLILPWLTMEAVRIIIVPLVLLYHAITLTVAGSVSEGMMVFITDFFVTAFCIYLWLIVFSYYVQLLAEDKSKLREGTIEHLRSTT